MSDAPSKPPTLPELLWALASLIFRREALLMVAAVALLLVVGGSTVIWAQAQQKTAASDVVEPLERRIQAVEDAGRRHAAESAEIHLELKRDMAELARDVRELYRVVKDPSRRSERLEQPVVDGGPP